MALRRPFAVAALACLAVASWATPASAHAAVTASSPAEGAHLAHVPRTVTINFDQPVRPDAGGLVVLNSAGQQVQVSTAHPSPTTVSATLPASLGSGAYVSDYTVTSVDGHVVSGGIVFLVGHVKAGAISALTTRPRTSFTNWVDDVGQFLMYVGVLVGAGLAFFLTFIWRGGDERRRLRRWTYSAVALAVVGMTVAGAAQAALTGGGFSAVAHWSLDTQSFGGKFGEQCGAQLVGLAACLVSLHLRSTIGRQFAAFYGLLIAAGAFVLFGHALVSAERWLSIPADIVHVVFAAMWAGGLVGLVTVLLSRTKAARLAGQMPTRATAAGNGAPGAVSPARATAGTIQTGSRVLGSATSTALLERPETTVTTTATTSSAVDPALKPDQTRPPGHAPPPVDSAKGNGDAGALLADTTGVVGRFSTMAGASFAGIVVAGTLLAVAEVGSVANLFETGYGQLLLLKISVVGLLLFVAGYNRYLLLPGLLSATATANTHPGALARGWQRLVSTVRLEALGMVAVLGVTAVLANGTPSNSATAPPPVPFTQTQPFNGGHVTLHISPNAALVNDWTVQFTGSGGEAADLAESVSVYLVLPSQNVGPIEADMHRTGIGRFVMTSSPNPPIVGKWQIVLQVQVSEFSQPNVSFVDTVQ